MVLGCIFIYRLGGACLAYPSGPMYRTRGVRHGGPEGYGMVDPRGTVLYIIMRMEHGEIYSVVFQQDFKAADYKESGGIRGL